MEEIDQKLDQWIYNSIIRTEIRELIVKAITEANKLGYIAGSTTDHKLNTNTNG